MPTTSPKPFCFVLMPFASEFNDVYEFGIKGACTDAGLYCERVDEQVFLGSMLDRIYSQISRADILVADMSGKNSNVFYEVGYAHALGRPVLLLTREASDIPFDLKHFPHIVYGDQIKSLRGQLARRISMLREAPDPTKSSPLAIELYLRSEPLATGTVVQKFYINYATVGASLTAYNGTNSVFDPGEMQIAAITPPPFSCNYDGAKVTELPDGAFLHMLPQLPPLFPGSYTSVDFFTASMSLEPTPCTFDFVIRIFTSLGSRDFPLKFEVAYA